MRLWGAMTHMINIELFGFYRFLDILDTRAFAKRGFSFRGTLDFILECYGNDVMIFYAFSTHFDCYVWA